MRATNFAKCSGVADHPFAKLKIECPNTWTSVSVSVAGISTGRREVPGARLEIAPTLYDSVIENREAAIIGYL